MDHDKLWKILQEMEIPDNLICLLRNLYAGQKQQNGHGATDWFKIRKGVFQGYILSPCLFNYMQSACEMPSWMNHKLESRLPGDINNLRYADNTTPMTEREEEWTVELNGHEP